MFSDQITLRDLGDGLRLRRATPADVESLIALNAEIFAPIEGASAQWMVQGGSPFGALDTFIVGEDTTQRPW